MLLRSHCPNLDFRSFLNEMIAEIIAVRTTIARIAIQILLLLKNIVAIEKANDSTKKITPVSMLRGV